MPLIISSSNAVAVFENVVAAAVSGCGNSSVSATPVTDAAPGDTPQQLQSKKQLADKAAKQAAVTDAIFTSSASSNPEAIAFT
jgi:hypothetical protein